MTSSFETVPLDRDGAFRVLRDGAAWAEFRPGSGGRVELRLDGRTLVASEPLGTGGVAVHILRGALGFGTFTLEEAGRPLGVARRNGLLRERTDLRFEDGAAYEVRLDGGAYALTSAGATVGRLTSKGVFARGVRASLAVDLAPEHQAFVLWILDRILWPGGGA